MADLNFPSSPTLYQQYSLNGQTFVWDGKRWKFTASSVVSISSGSAITSINNLITTEQFFATGDQGSSFNISSFGSTHTFNIPIAGIASTGLVSTLSQSFGGIKTFTNDLIISSSTSSTSPYTGALTISGGVGIGGSLFLSSLFPSSLSGIVVNNGVITSGSWSGSTITEFYGGTGYNSYTKGDILVGAGNTFIKLNVGSDNFVLTALSSSSTGLTWSPTSATGLTTLNGLSVGIQNLSFGYSGSVPAFSSSGSTHTLNIPLAGIASTGLVSTLAQSFAGIKTFTNAVSITDNTGSGTTLTGALIVTGGVGIGNSINLAGSLNFWNPASTYFVSLKSGITTASTIYTLPPYYPSFGQSVLSADTNGNLSWVLVSANAGQGTVATGAQYQIAGYYSGTAASVSGSSTFTNNLATNSVFINHTTASTATTNGALVVSGGVGISGQLSYNTALIGNTGVSSTPTMTFIGTNGDPIKLRVLDDSTLAFSGSQGQLFSINPVLNTGYIFSVNDISGVPLIRANADATVSMAEFAGNVGIGLSNPAFKLQVLGNAGISGTAFISNTSSSISTTSGALTVLGGVGIGGSLYVAGASNISSVIFNAGIIYGTLVGSATSAGFATTSNYSHTSGFGITSGFATTSAYSHQSGYAITSGSSITSGFATTAGLATTATNINVVSALSNASHPILFTPATGSASGAAISSEASFVYNPFTDILSVSGLAVTSGTVATNFSSGALVVAGGVGIGGSLFVNGDLTINGTTTTINSVTLTVDDKNIELGSVSSPSDVTAEGGGITLRGSSDKFINWYTGTGWSSSESWNLASGNTYKINNISVLSATSLGTGVTNSSLTAVGTITTGVWAATAITALYGGTGLVPAFNVGDILYANTSTTWGRLSASSNSGYVLASAGSGVTPTYVAPSTLSVGLATTANYSHQSGYAITSGSSALATTANYAHQSGYAITSGFATTSAYSHQSGYAITSGSSGTATTATYSHLSGFAVTSGLATTANYAHQSGYATTSGLSGLATTATYAHQSGYAITSGSSATATTATYAHQSGFAITSGFATTAGLATTATYAHQSGYGLTSGFAQTATYSSQSGYGLTAGLATSSTSSFINSANTNTSHPIIFAPITGSSSGSGLSINTTLNYNPSTNILYSSGLAVTASTLSTSSSSGALIVTGGIGVGSTSYFRTDLNVGNSTQGRLYFSQATLGSAGTTVIPSMAFIGTTNSPITLSVLPDNSLSFDGSSGQLFSINNNLSTGWIFSINDISGLPIFRANADLTVSMGEYGGNTGIGLSNPSYKLHVAGDTNLSSGYVYRINGNSVLSSSSLGTGITNSNLTAVGTITTGTWSGSAITSLYGGTGYQTYSTGDLLVGTGSTLSKLSVGANNFILVADNAVVGGVKWANVSGVAITNINGLTASKQDLAFGYLGTVPAFASSGNTHTLNIPIAGSGSTGLVSTQAQTFAGQKTFTSAIIGDLVGTATTSGFATTASYAHQSGYGLTSGFATTANYSHQSGYGLTSGFATTANYANQSGYATTSGLATTATYSHQSGYAITSGSSNTSGLATTATNINVVSASTSASHSVLFTPASGTASGAALSTESTFVYNPSTDILSVSGLAVTATTTSTNSGTGALRVAGGVGISGELNLNNNTSTSNFAFFSGSTNQPANVTIQNTFSGSSAASQLTLNNNDSSSFVLIGVGSTNNSFIPAFYGSIIPTNFGYIIGGGGFGANSGGLSVGAGSTLILFAKGSGHRLTLSGTGLSIFANVSSTSTTSGALTVSGGAGIGGSIFGGSTISAADNIEIRSGKELRFNNVGNSSYTGFKAGANAVNTTYTLPTAFPGTGTSVLQSDTSGTLSWVGSVGLATTATYAITAGTATTAQNVHLVSNSTSDQQHRLVTARYSGSGIALSGSDIFTVIPSESTLYVSGTVDAELVTALEFNVYSGIASTSPTSGDLRVTGGAGIGGSVSIGGRLQMFNGANYTSFVSSASGNTVYTLPATSPATGTSVLQSNSAGLMSWVGIVGNATTATYALQSGYAITSGLATSAGFATTATYAHQSGYAITSGFATTAANINIVATTSSDLHHITFSPVNGGSGVGLSTTALIYVQPDTGFLTAPWLDAIQIDGINVTATNFSGTAVTATNFYGPLTGNVTGTATTATYAHQSGYGSTSGFATTANYAHQSGYAITSGSSNTSGYATTSGTATTATNVNVVSAATNSSHPILFTPTQGTASGTAASSSGPLSYNPFSSILSVSGLAVTAATPSTGFNSGALIVAGGVGIGGSLYVNGDLTINGTTTTINSVTLTVDDKNIELGSVASPSDATAEGGGITLRGSTDKSINWYSGVGWSSSESWNLASGNTFKINGTSILSSSSLGTGVTNSSLTALGIITTGTWSGSTITAYYGGTGYNSYTKGDILVGAGNTFIKLNVGSDNFVLTASSTSATGLTWAQTAATGITTLNSLTSTQQYFATGTSGSGFNISSSGSTHTFNIPIAGTGATGLVSTLAQSFAGVKTFTNDVIISSSTASTFVRNGALQVYGGVGISGQLSFNQAAMGFTGILTNPSIAFIGTTGSPITLSVLADNSLSFEGSSGQLFSIDNNLTTGEIFAVSDISGLPIISAYANQNVTIGEFGGNLGIGLSNPFYKLHVIGSVGFTSNIASTSTSTGTLVVNGGVGIGGSLNANSASSISGVRLDSGIIYGNLVGTATTAGFASTSNYANQSGFAITSGIATTATYAIQSGYAITSGSSSTANTASYAHVSGFAITSGFATTATYAHQSGYAITSGSSGLATTATYAHQSGYAITSGSSGLATTANNINVVSASTSASHPVLFTPATGTASGAALSTESTFVYNPSTDILSVSGLAITSGTASTSPTTGALVVAGGVGIGGTLRLGTQIVGAPNPFIAGFAGSTSGFVSLAIQNTENGILSRSGIQILNNSGWAAIDLFASGSLFANRLTITNNAGSIHYSATDVHNFIVSTLIMAINGTKVSISPTTASTNTTSGALTVSGGVGIGGSVFTSSSNASSISGVILNNGAITNTGTITSTGVMSLSNSSTTALSIKDGSNNTKFNVDTVGGIVSVSSSTTSTNTTSGAFVVTGGVGIGGSLYVASATAISGVTINAGVITGSLVGTATTSGFASTSSYSHQSGYAITSGSSSTSGYATTSDYSHQSGFAITSGFATTATYAHTSGFAITSGLATTASYAHQSGFAITSGFATTAAYSYTSGYGITSGLATTATYAHQSGFALTATTSTNSTFSTLTADTTNATRRLIFSANGTGSTSLYNTSTLFTNPFNSSVGASVFTGSGSVNIRPGIDATSGVSIGNSSGTPYVYFDTVNGRIGINQPTPLYDLHIVGEISATNKSFVIDHPTKANMMLRHGSLEGPENGVYVRGKLVNKNIIQLPEYWLGLVDEETITVSLTPVGKDSKPYIEKIENYKVYVNVEIGIVNCHFVVYGERKDIPKLDVEY